MPPDYGTEYHPLQGTCRQIRSEFPQLILSKALGANDRVAYVVDSDFREFSYYLRDTPPLRTPCELTIYFNLTRPSNVWVEGFEQWDRECTPVADPPLRQKEVLHVIHGSKYKISFQPGPGSVHHIPHPWSLFSPYRNDEVLVTTEGDMRKVMSERALRGFLPLAYTRRKRRIRLPFQVHSS